MPIAPRRRSRGRQSTARRSDVQALVDHRPRPADLGPCGIWSLAREDMQQKWRGRSPSMSAGEAPPLRARVLRRRPAGGSARVGARRNIVGPLDALPDHADRRGTLLVLGVGLPHLKARLTERLAPTGLAWATVIHPRAVIGPNVEIGPGSYVAAGAIVTVNVRARRVRHDQHARPGRPTALSGVTRPCTRTPTSRATSGSAKGPSSAPGRRSFPECTIGPWAVLGAGAVAIESLEGDRTYVGVPAAPTRPRVVARA